ncbi:NAD(P)/FAD-dependent oxidoreductase [Marinobacter nanhaiticus D15-8W]|uniref:NAD(P)/FAD-dependent oxidoreductase n=1 Tax=Marinobacter nanhaiticus D15-8W TaxID=626887 RepID=N6WUE1_9GAMM|nr:NAD(P)/FAD-dependent oxidoreductase [Marinobacter nanhaiticus]ENO15151.1 NAD(P)/FAD-dependent oxidoreductase [Marinobacter nanhaiticus D15-8W]BES69150.1 NAD(P)/FAD-dependent oxidoreductase [Marinobacter nanhaiticus D15-8W]
MANQHFDVLIVGAGLSGIGAAYHIQTYCTDKTYAILEGRASIGGTWDIFRYPGIRSDSDMYTLGYSFRPWREDKSLADGPSILSYVKSTAADYGIDEKIRFNHWVTRYDWSSADATWTVTAKNQKTGRNACFTCNFIINCSGYYRYDQGYMPNFPGVENFKGRLIHPQHWPEDLDYSGKRVVVIGSGATAVTLVPAMAQDAAQVTMLQRSPTWIVSLPDVDLIARTLNRVLPTKAAYQLTRWKNVGLQTLFFQACRRYPKLMRKLLRQHLRSQLGRDFDIDTHFNPSYDPWDQRLCLVPNGDLFRALRKGSANVVTDHIDTFTEKGIRLKSGEELEADIVVSATGLNLVALGDAEVTVDKQKIALGDTMSYKGMMLSNVPNLALVVGYTNASWTLKADLTSEYVCRILNYMDRQGYEACTPVVDDDVKVEPFIDLDSGYVLRALDRLPKQGDRKPWKLYQNYLLDLVNLRYGRVDDSGLVFSRLSPVGDNATLAEQRS